MPNMLILHDDISVGAPLLRDLTKEGYKVAGLDDVDLIWKHIRNTQPDLVLLDSGSDGFGIMNLYFEIKEKLPDLAVIIYQCRNYGDVDRIKGAVADALETIG